MVALITLAGQYRLQHAAFDESRRFCRDSLIVDPVAAHQRLVVHRGEGGVVDDAERARQDPGADAVLHRSGLLSGEGGHPRVTHHRRPLGQQSGGEALGQQLGRRLGLEQHGAVVAIHGRGLTQIA